MFSLRLLKIFAVCLTPCVFHIPVEFNAQANEEHSRLSLGRDNAYYGVTSVSTEYFVTTFQEINFTTCVQNCLLHSRECAALLYSKTLLSCELLKCHLNDKLVLNTTEGDDWEYWRNNQACDEDWTPFAGHCYFYNDTLSTWDDAEDFCNGEDSYLVEMNSPEENSWVTESFLLPVTGVEEQCPEMWRCSVWIGATYHAPSGTFVLSHSGSQMVIPEWAGDQPNNHGGNQECVAIVRSGTANDMACSVMYSFVCEKD